MTRIGYLILFVLFTQTLAAQSDYRIALASGAIRTEANLEAWLQGPAPEATDIVKGHYYRLLQFETLPNSAARTQIEATGIQLLEYIPNNTYFAAIPAQLDRQVLRGIGIRAVIRMEAQHKIKQNLQELPLPVWAVPAPGVLDVEINFPKNLKEADVRAMILAEGLELLPSTYAGVVTTRIPAHLLNTIATRPWVSFIEPLNPPAYPENYTGRTLHRSNMIASDHAMGRQYDGTGVVVAMGDDGIIGAHIDYQGRADQSRVNQNNGDHGDHVAGTIMGAGNLNPKHKGMAYGATLHVYQVWNAVNNGASANANDGVLITSTSYSDGCNAGYTSFARSVDQMTRQNPTLLHVFSAGNEGTADCGYGAGATWGNVTGGVKIGKNVLAVAALNANGSLESFSSRGPAHDGRIKPEVSAKGGNVTSPVSVNTYETSSGTSMSCPGVSGTIAQLDHAYRTLNGGADPASALMKAIVMNSADDIGNAGPDFRHGFGELNAYRAVLALEGNTYLLDTLDQAEADTHMLTVPAGTALMKVMVYWHDYEGSTMTGNALVNDLDIQLLDPSSNTYLPWILDHTPSASALNQPATRGRDSINNVEQVTITAPAAGSYQLIVRGRSVPSGPQAYAMVYEYRDSAVTITYPNGGEAWAPGETEKIRWDAEGNQGTWTVEYTTNSGNTWTVAGSGISGSLRRHDFTLPNNIQSGHVKFRVSRTGSSDESDHELSIIRVPTNVQVDAACPTYCILDWDSLATASGYDVFMLGNKYMDSIGTTTNSFFQVPGITPNQGYWFAVRARGADGARGRRTIAIYKAPGVWNCQEPNDVAVAAVIGPGAGVLQTCATGSNLTVTVELESHSPNTMTNVPVSYRLDGGAVVTENFTGSLVGFGTAQFTFSTQLPTPANGTHTIEAWTAFGIDNYTTNDSSSIVIEQRSGTAATLPFTEDFETFNLCGVSSNCTSANCSLVAGWQQGTNNVTDDTEWRVDRGGTPTTLTGPAIDKYPGTNLGQYMYIEASSCFDQEAATYTPCLDLSGMTTPYLSYWFHMYGADMGELHVDIFANGRWINDVTSVASANWTDRWWERQVNLSAYAGQTVNFRFRGITGGGDLSDMAIDLIRITEGAPVSTDPAALQNDLVVYPNPTTGMINFTLGQPDVQELRLTLRDMSGRVVIRENFTNFTQGAFQGTLNLQDQPVGVYFLEIWSGDRRFGKQISLTK